MHYDAKLLTFYYMITMINLDLIQKLMNITMMHVYALLQGYKRKRKQDRKYHTYSFYYTLPTVHMPGPLLFY